jgi:hypothetical protein
MKRKWPGASLIPDAEAAALWSGVREFTWAHADGVLAKIPITPGKLAPVATAVGRMPGARAHFSSAGFAAYVSLPSPAELAPLDAELRAQELSGLVLRGSGVPARIGAAYGPLIAEAVRAVFDPLRRFAPLE